MPSDESGRRGKGLGGCRDGGQLQQARWMHGRGHKRVGRHQAHGMRKNVRRTVRVHGTHRADVNPFFADAVVEESAIEHLRSSVL